MDFAFLYLLLTFKAKWRMEELLEEKMAGYSLIPPNVLLLTIQEGSLHEN